MSSIKLESGIPGLLRLRWILPRAKNSPPDCFYTSVRTGAALSNPPSLYIKSPHPLGVDYLWQRMRDSMKSRCCRRSAGGKQQSTGLLHSNRFESPTTTKNPDTRTGIWIIWQRMRDSNPRKRSQSPVCYRYTNPLNQRSLIICNFWEKSSNF